MEKIIITAAITFLSSFSYGQQLGQVEQVEFDGIRQIRKKGYRRPGTIEAIGTYGVSTMLNRKSKNYYLTALAEYHFDQRVSLRSDSYYYLNSPDENPFIDKSIRSYFGIFYHLNRDQFSNWDVTLGFQPGVTIMSKNNYDPSGTLAETERSRMVLSPSFAVSCGAKYYVWKYFNFFANVSYMNSNLGGIQDGPFNTDEIVLSGGLGFHIQTHPKQSYRHD